MYARHVDGANVTKMTYDLDEEVEYTFEKKQLEYEETHPICPECGGYMSKIFTQYEHYFECKCGYYMVRQ